MPERPDYDIVAFIRGILADWNCVSSKDAYIAYAKDFGGNIVYGFIYSDYIYFNGFTNDDSQSYDIRVRFADPEFIRKLVHVARFTNLEKYEKADTNKEFLRLMVHLETYGNLIQYDIMKRMV